MNQTCPACKFMTERAWERCRFCGHDLSTEAVEATPGPLSTGPPPPPATWPGSPAEPTPSQLSAQGATAQRADQVSPVVLGAAAIGLVALIALLVGVTVAGAPTEEEAAVDGIIADGPGGDDAEGIDGAEPLTPTQLTQICDGVGVEDTAELSTGPVRRPLQVAALREGEWEPQDPPDAVGNDADLPANVVELVACRHPLPEPEIAECAYESYPYIELTHHAELVQVRAARTGELLEEVVISAPRPSCPTFLMIRDHRAQTDFYDDKGVTEYLLGHIGDTTRPDLAIEDRLASLCRGSRAITRISGAPAGGDPAVAVVAHTRNNIEFPSGLAGSLGAADSSQATHVLCLEPEPVTTVSDGAQECIGWEPTLIRLHDGAVLLSPDDGTGGVVLDETCFDEDWFEGLPDLDVMPALAVLASGG